jgi:hypothetical protein
MGEISVQKLAELINGSIVDQEVGCLNFLWETRFYLDSHRRALDPKIEPFVKGLGLDKYHRFLDRLGDKKEDLLIYLIAIASYSYVYVQHFLREGSLDRSLRAILKICFNPQITGKMEYSDPELDVLSNMFNLMFKSGRKNLHCYDCGTVARGVFYSLVKEHRKNFGLNSREIYQLRDEYLYLDHNDGFVGLDQLMERLRSIGQPCAFIVGLKFGPDKFGHIFVIEKLWYEGEPVIRFYQSALNSYLLMDYLVRMNYLESPNIGVDLDDFEKDMRHLLTVPRWKEREELLFVKWFAFYPQSEIDDTSLIRINNSYVIY